MMKNSVFRLILFSLAGIKRTVFLLTLLLAISCCYSQQHTTAVKGILDLRNRSWAKNGIINLDGEWAFYWNKLYTPASFDSAQLTPSVYAVVPGFWNSIIPNQSWFKPAFGYATYRLKVLCPPSDKQLALEFLTIASTYKLFVNGKQLTEIGKVGTSEATTTPAYQPMLITVTPVNNTLDIVIQVANFNYSIGGLWDVIQLGTQEQIIIYRIKNIAQDFFITGSFFLIGIFYLVIYFFFRRGRSPLYFALFCILIGFRPLVTGELGINYITSLSWQFIKHVEFLSVYLTVPVLSLFSYELFPREFSKKMLRYILFISIPFIVAAIFTSPFIFRYTLRPFQLFMILTSCYGLYVYMCAVKHSRVGSVYFLAGFIILFITIINDILYTTLIIHSINLLYAGLYILVICQATTVAKQFFQAFIKIEKLNKQLEQINSELNTKNDMINETNEQLNKLNAELDNLVFRTSHDLKSPITSMLAMTEVIKMEADKDKKNEYVDFQKKIILRLDALINEILQYAKNKSTALQYEPINLEEFIQNALQDQLFSYRSEKIKRMIEVSQPCVFKTDKTRLSMIINNLISNGLKHHNKEQENPYLKIVVHVTEKEATIEVTDNGQGIAQEHLDHIFTKFYRVNTKSAGSGFGLYIVKETVEKLGGTIRVESQVGVGTSFFIVIPNAAYS
ncbi:GHKL domain-containing protein [Ilyomonas limi]|uniref:histidine kinase n=1 Tax=Ilyomonas limi TaxID=2575867 RepID=A0A4U3L1V0_9BACT|nr:ATP-binding protein [Ilyomonas limi]TKK67476.1 GHKL domain-containing protein [Ilyomonas limi]